MALRHRVMLHTFVIPWLQQRQYLESTTFMKDTAPPHIGCCVQQFLQQHLTENRVISNSFPTTWPPHSPDFYPCDFWLWGQLKSVVYQGHVTYLAVLKDSIILHVRSITADQLWPDVEHIIHRLQVLHLQNGDHTEQYPLHHQGFCMSVLYTFNICCLQHHNCPSGEFLNFFFFFFYGNVFHSLKCHHTNFGYICTTKFLSRQHWIGVL